MRSQELLALEAGHIEPDGSCVHIRQAVKQVKGTVFVGGTKSASSVRDVPIPEAYRGMVAGLREYCTPYLWTGRGVGKPCNPTHFRDKFAEALKSKGPVWIECVIDKDEKVLPMIPAGGSIEDMIMD